ncbi:MAG: leucine-rich repeat protein [Clostridia bacterium]|nr:leucine-rich repeat protein [Clostridia bacterium]
MKKRLIFLLTLAMSASFSLGMAACGGKKSPSSDSLSSQTSSSTTSSTESSSSTGKRTHTLSFETSGSAVESVTVEEGETIELSQYTSTKEGAEFVGWIYGGCDLLSEITLERDMELTAVFTGDVINAGNNVYFGKYPQQRVKDEALIAKLEAEAKRNQNPAKVTYEGKEYIRKGSPYRGVFADGTKMEGHYYFELQPLLWTRVSGTPNEGVSTWTTWQVIDATTYYDGSSESFSHYYETEYCEFAHMDFIYETDYFSLEERELMVSTETDDFKYSVVYVTAPSYSADYISYTDYAATQEVAKYKIEGNSFYDAVYWLYNESLDSGDKLKVSNGGKWNGKADCDELMGFRPVIKLDLRPSTTLTFETNGGDAMESKAYKVGDFLPTTTKNGYEFAGWYLDADLTEFIDRVPAEAMKLYAKWRPKSHNITYELNAYYGTDNAPAADNHADNPATYTIEDDVVLKAPTAKAGTPYLYYTFGGWYKDEDLTQKVENVSALGGDEVTLYAKWTMTDYTITYMLNGGTNHAENPATINYASERFTLKDPTKAGYDFEGWYLNSEFTAKITWLEPGQHPFYTGNVVGEVTLYALFEEIYERTEGDVTYRIKDDVVTVVALADPTKTSAVIPATVEGKTVNAIAASTFANAAAVTDITFDCSVDVIETLTSEHFTDLTNLQNVVAATNAIAKVVKHLPNKTLKTWTVTDATFSGWDITNCTVEKIVLGDKVEKISGGAFNKLVGVKEIYIGKDVVMSATNAYLTTSSASSELAFETLTIPDSSFLSKFYSSTHTANLKDLTILGGAFSNAKSSVEKITLGADVTAGSYSFLANLSNLEEIVVDSANTVFSIVDDALVESGNKLVYLFSGNIPACVTEIAAYASAKSITELVIPEGVTKIGEGAFSGNTTLVKLSLPASLTSLNTKAFSNSVKTLDVACDLDFYGSKLAGGVETLTVTAKSVDSFSDWYTLKTANLVGVEIIGKGAFSNCSALESVSMPALKTGDKEVFTRCKNLKTVTLGENFTAIPDYMFSYEWGSSYPNYLLSSLQTINLNYVKTIGNNAFNGCTSLNVTLGDNVQSIGYYAFKDCAITGDLNLPASLTKIGSDAFYGCTGITAVKYAGTLAQWEAVMNNGFITHAVDYYCNGEKVTDYSPSGDVGNYIFAYNKALESVDLTSAKAIGSGAFRSCANLEEVTGASALETIGDYAFYGCAKLPATVLAAATKVTTIGRYAFSECTGMTGVMELNEGLTSLGSYAFFGCTGITKVVFPSTLVYLGDRTFKDTGLVEVVINTNKLDSGDGTGDYWYEGLQVETITVKVQPKDTNDNAIRLEGHGWGLLANVKTLKLTGDCPTLYYGAQSLSKLETLILDEGIKSIGMYSLTNLTNLKTLVVKADVKEFACNKMGSFANITTIENLYSNAVVYTGITTQANGGITVTNHYTVDQWTGM